MYIGFAGLLLNLVVVAAGSVLAAVMGRDDRGGLAEEGYAVRRTGDATRTATVAPVASVPGTGA